ncbi:MAG: hypothetical protein GF335_02445 [Candidatus Moranbacteria bacterium]|nr:hypothetical protein [Candidatus Moranbacteria bacterium]
MTIIKTQKEEEAEKSGLPNELQRFSEDLISPQKVINLKKEVGLFDFNLYWLELKHNQKTVEGTFSFDQKLTRKLIVFVPGFPGDGSVRFEVNHLEEVAKNKYSIFCLRHNGTILNGKYSDNFIGFKSRQNQVKSAKSFKTIGSKQLYSMNDLINEPKTVLSVLAKEFEEIYLIGHSFGVLSIIYSLLDFSVESKNLISKIKRVVSLAGTTGIIRGAKSPVLKMWSQLLNSKTNQKIINLKQTADNLDFIKQAYNRIHLEAFDRIPNSIDFVFVFPWGDIPGSTDEFISPIENLEFITNFGRGSLIIDKNQKSDIKKNILAHDMNNLKTSTILDLIRNDKYLNKRIDVI